MKLKRILASVLAAAMVVTSVPVAGLGGISVQAAEEVTQPAENERIYYPDENGNFTIPETDMAFFNSVEALEISMAYRLTQESDTGSTNAMALFTLEGADKKHLTVYHAPKRSDRNLEAGESIISYSFFDGTNHSIVGQVFSRGSGAGDKWALRDLKWHKLTFALDDTKTMEMRYDDEPFVWDLATNISKFPQAGVVGSGTAYTGAYVGKKSETAEYLTGRFAAMQDFPGEIKYVKVSGKAYSTSEVAKDHENVEQKCADEFAALKDECDGLVKGKYTKDSWAALETAKTAAEAAATEWAVLNATDALKAALAGLVEKPVTPEGQALEAALAAAAAVDEDGKTYTEESKKALTDAVAAANALTDDAAPEEIQAAANAIQAAIDNLVEALPTAAEYTGTITATADSEEKTGEAAPSGPVSAAIDGNTGSFWHSNWSDGNAAKAEFDAGATRLTGNNNLYIHLAEASSVTGVSYVPRINGSGARTANGSITKANIYVRKDGESDGTWTLVAENVTWSYDNWNYNTDGAKTAIFRTVDNVTDVRIEAINTQGGTAPENNQYINAAEVDVLAPGEPIPDAREKISAPNIALTAPTAENGFTDAVGDSYAPAEIKDGAEAPADLTSSAKVVADGDILALDGIAIADQSKEANAKLNITGSEKFLIKFKMKIDSEKLNKTDTFAVVGKMDEQYGVQITGDTSKNVNYIAMFAKAGTYQQGTEGSNPWPEQKLVLTEDNMDVWQDVVAMYDGNAFSLYVGGKRDETAGKKIDRGNFGFTLGENKGNSFAIGKNTQANKASVKNFPGLIADVVMYKGDQVPAEADFTEETKEGETVVAKTVNADKLTAALADKKAMFDLKLTPASGQEPKYDLKTAWTDGEGNAPTAYEKGAEYTATMTLTAHQGYKFTNVTSFPVVTVDGTEVAPKVVIEDDALAGTSVMTVSYTFEVSAKDKAELALAKALEEAKALTNENGNYTEESWNALQDAIAAAEALNTTDMDADAILAEVTKLDDAVKALVEVVRDTAIGTPTVSLTAPEAGKYPAPAAVTNAADAAHHEDIADRTENPEVFTKKDAASVAVLENTAGIWGFNDVLTGTADGKFDIFGEDPMVLSFKLYVKKTGNNQSCINILGKMDHQYGFQLGADRLLLYMCNASGDWPEQQYMVDTETFYNAWHDVIVVIDGNGKMGFYVDGEASSKNEGHAADDCTAGHYDEPFTIGYNPIKDPSTMFTSDYGYLADIKLYTTDVTEGMTKDYGAIRNLLEAETPAANITVTPYDTKTTWKVTDGDAMDGTANFAENTAYTATTVLTAHDGFVFDKDSAPTVAAEGATVTVEVAEDGKTVTITAAYPVTTELPCTCDLTLTAPAKAIKLDEKYTEKTEKLSVTTTVTGDCEVTDHPNDVTVTYVVKSGDDVATVDAEGNVTAKKPGEAVITVTAVLNKKGEETVQKSEDVTVTVTSTRASQDKVDELKAAVDAAKASIADGKDKLYTKESVEELQNAINSAEDLLAKAPAVTETAVNSEIGKLKNVKLVLQEDVDKEDLHKLLGELIDDAKEKSASNLYSQESVNALTAANNAAVATYNKAIVDGVLHLENVTLAELKKAYDDLKAAMDALVTKTAAAAKAELTKAVNAAAPAFKAGNNGYTTESWNAFVAAYNAALKGSSDPAAMKKLADALNKAQAGLKKAAPPIGAKVPDPSGKFVYKITGSDTAEVIALGDKNKNAKKVTVFATVKLGGKSFKVTSIGANVFKKNKKVTSVVIGKNVKKIGKSAFANCKKLKKITVKSKVLKKVTKNAFKGINKKATIKVPKKKRAAYKKLFRKAKVARTVKIK